MQIFDNSHIQGPQARLCDNSYSSSRSISGLPVETRPHHEFRLLRGRKDASQGQANWAARVLHGCSSSLIHPDLLLQNISRDLMPNEECSPGMQSESYGNQWLEDVLFTCCYHPQTKWWISFKHTVHCDLFKPKDMPYLKNSFSCGISHCSSLVACQQNFTSEHTTKNFGFWLPERCIWPPNEVQKQFHFYHVLTEPDNNHNTLKLFIFIPGGHQNA